MKNTTEKQIESLTRKIATLTRELGLGPGLSGLTDTLAASSKGRQLIAAYKARYNLSPLAR